MEKAKTISPKRNRNIDLIKGICIILMVLGHTPFIDYYYGGFMYLFHMAVFFIASGYLFNCKYTDNVKMLGKFFVKKIKGLWLPFFLFTEGYILLNNLFIQMNIYLTSVPSSFDKSLTYSTSHFFDIKDIIISIPYTLLMDNATHMGGALWFFQVLFYVLILYAVVDYIIKKITKNNAVNLVIQAVISIGLLTFGYYCSLNNLFTYSFGRVASVYILIFIGVIFKRIDIISKMRDVKNKWIVNISIFVVIIPIFLFCQKNIGTVGLDKNIYVNPIYYIFISVTGWFWVVSISNILLYLNLKINKIIEYISQRAVSIIALHFLCFKIVTLIGIMVYGLDIRYLAASNELFKDGLWWLLYTVIGIVVPLLIDYIYLKIKGKIVLYIRKRKQIKV